MLTALTRLGVDPWVEAARLADLPRDVAVTALAAFIARLPEGNWKAADAEAIALRVANFLPGHSAAPAPRKPQVEFMPPGVQLWWMPLLSLVTSPFAPNTLC